MTPAIQLNEFNTLTMPVIHDLQSQCGKLTYQAIERMFDEMWSTYIAKGNRLVNNTPVNTISLPYWAHQINDPKSMNLALKILSKSGWITVSTRPNNNWSEASLNESKLLEYTDQATLDGIRKHHKFSKYKLTHHESNQDMGATTIKANGKSFTTPIAMIGFAKTATTEFKYDTTTMFKQHELVLSEVNKGIEKTIVKYPGLIDDHANYRDLATDVVDSLMYDDATYSSGPRTSDPRLRNNAGYLSKVANPVGYKVMRGLLVIPEAYRNTCTPNGLKNKYLFIAELNGFKSGSTQSKIDFGRECFYNATQPHCPVEAIWVNRTYTDVLNAFGPAFDPIADSVDTLKQGEANAILNSNHKWTTPIEIDMSASVLGFMGLLLNHKPFMDRCNITHGELSDAWGHDIVTNRNQFKTIMTNLYGSQQATKAKWTDLDMPFTQDEVDAFDYELEHGEMAVANRFKDFIINNCNPTAKMNLHVLDNKVPTSCNKFHHKGEKTTAYDFYDTATNSAPRVHNTSTVKVPDLNSFRRYMVTGLIHGLDANVMDNAVDAVMDKYNWCIDIHDAMVLCCEAADYGREIYANGRTADEPSLKRIHTNRNTILTNYFKSIGITGAAMQEWATEVKPHIQPLTEELIVNPLVLK